MRALRIATRKSDLALWQAGWVQTRLRALGTDSSLVLIDTQGDRDQSPLRDLQGQGFFTKAVQDAVLDGRADVAVHSYKDLPSEPIPGLEVAAVSERADPRDVLVGHRDLLDEGAPELPLAEGATVGTSAARRRGLLADLRPDLRKTDLRGNVPTRLRKLAEGACDAVILAAAGLERLGLDPAPFFVRPLDPERFVPAPAQGTLALEIRRANYELAALLTNLHDNRAHRAVAAERGLMAMIQGGCQLALGAHATLGDDGNVSLVAFFEGRRTSTAHPSSEGAAMLAFDRLGRPRPKQVAG